MKATAINKVLGGGSDPKIFLLYFLYLAHKKFLWTPPYRLK